MDAVSSDRHLIVSCVMLPIDVISICILYSLPSIPVENQYVWGHSLPLLTQHILRCRHPEQQPTNHGCCNHSSMCCGLLTLHALHHHVFVRKYSGNIQKYVCCQQCVYHKTDILHFSLSSVLTCMSCIAICMGNIVICIWLSCFWL